MVFTEPQRRTALAVLVSIVLHGLLGFWLRDVFIETAPPPSPGVLIAQLLQPVEAPATPSPAPVAEPEPPREKPLLSDKTLDKKPRPPEAPSPPAAAPASAPGTTGMDLADVLDAAPIVQAEVFDPAMVGRYRAVLLGEMGRQRFYPLTARVRNQTGKVEMRLDFAQGQLVGIVVTRSSGHEALDEGAMQIVRAAHYEAVMPPPLKERSFSLERVQVDYELGPLAR